MTITHIVMDMSNGAYQLEEKMDQLADGYKAVENKIKELEELKKRINKQYQEIKKQVDIINHAVKQIDYEKAKDYFIDGIETFKDDKIQIIKEPFDRPLYMDPVWADLLSTEYILENPQLFEPIFVEVIKEEEAKKTTETKPIETSKKVAVLNPDVKFYFNKKSICFAVLQYIKPQETFTFSELKDKLQKDYPKFKKNRILNAVTNLVERGLMEKVAYNTYKRIDDGTRVVNEKFKFSLKVREVIKEFVNDFTPADVFEKLKNYDISTKEKRVHEALRESCTTGIISGYRDKQGNCHYKPILNSNVINFPAKSA